MEGVPFVALQTQFMRIAIQLFLLASAGAQVYELPDAVVEADALDEDQKRGAEGVALAGNRTILSREELARATQNSLSKLLETKAGIPFTSFLGNSDLATPQLRGFGENSQLRTLVTVDGLPVNRSDLSVQPWSQFPAQSLQEVTVLRGGRTVRYGPDALAGVIALETRRPSEELAGSLEVTFGSDETFRQRLSLSSGVAGWGAAVQVENFVTDGYRDNSARESTSVNLSLISPEADWGSYRLTVGATRAFFEDPGVLSLSQFLSDPRSSSIFDEDLENETLSLGNRLQVSLGAGWDLVVKGSVSLSSREANFLQQTNEGDFIEGSGEVALTWEGEQWTLETGLRGRWSALDFERFSQVEEQDADLSRTSFGGFLTTRWEPDSRWTFSAGASWDRYLLSGDASSPTSPADAGLNFDGSASTGEGAFELGVEYELSKQAKVWARYDRSVRFPVLDEVAFFQGFTSAVPFNADLQPEKGQGVELGASWEGLSGWTVKGTVFAQRLEDEIFFDNFVNINENLPETERLGAEVQLGWEFDWGKAGLFYNYTYARFSGRVDEGRRIPLVPEHSFFASLTWSIREDLDLTVEGNYLSARNDGSDRGELGRFISFDEIPGRVLWNLSASWRPWPEVTLFCRVNNVFDEAFISSQFSGGIFPGVGRQILAGGKYEF